MCSYRFRCWLCTAFCLLFLSYSFGAKPKFEGSGKIDFFGYTDCVILENENTRVILGHQSGGRVLEYSWKGENALYLDPKDEGYQYESGKPSGHISAGRFDIGPEQIIPRHPVLWAGEWKAVITGPRSARLTSKKDTATGVQLIRKFTLDESTSRLSCKQTIKNVSEDTVSWCHWSRTFAKGGGICIVPLTPDSRFPHKYVMYGPGPGINHRPEDPNIRIRDGMLEIIGTPAFPKLGMDSYAGWLGYIMKNNLIFIKQYPTYPNRVYNEVAGLTLSIWYYKEEKCELEPIGPREIIAPGMTASFTETWWLLPYPYPEEGSEVNLADVENRGKSAK